ncbi:uncharacterized protein [Rutidosis leptorrhynchoides]|uniref:uncharacterized protein n=1 Tax=Rutidosis leptorrhynchoides TaxID=125765 RepID=UPI003A996B9F
MGDFNASLNIEETSAGSSKFKIAMREFQECVGKMCMNDVNHVGFEFTWNQRPQSSSGILKKIDRVMENDEFVSKFTNASVVFHPYKKSYHCPAVLPIPEGWKVDIHGHRMFTVVKRLRLLKRPIRKLMWCKGNLHARVVECRTALDKVQLDLDGDPHSSVLRSAVCAKLKDYNQAVLDEEMFLKQKFKIEWLRAGDNNTSYFHRVVKGRINRTRIHALFDANDRLVEGSDVPNLFVKHYEDFLRKLAYCNEIPTPGTLFVNRISQHASTKMIRKVSDSEIKRVMFDIGDNKSPGPDGYTSAFFKCAWDVGARISFMRLKSFFEMANC